MTDAAQINNHEPSSASAATVSGAFEALRDGLSRAGIADAEVDAELLIGHVLGLSRGQVQAAVITAKPLAASDAARLGDLGQRRATREPLQHITGIAPFRSLELAVGPGVFVPRPETEQVVQFAIDALRADADPTPIAIDLGTGSGAIALAMATEVPNARVYAAENSPEAFVWTSRNFRETNADNATLFFIDLADFLSVAPELAGRASVVISNPPYIPLEAVPRDPEVRLYDPPHALYGGADGLEVVRELSKVALRLLRSGGTLVIEHGEEQARAIAEILKADGWRAIANHRDLTTRDRATTAVR